MPLAQLGTLIMLNLVGMMTPGPDIFLLTRIATRSRKHALASVCGISTGLLLWVSLTVFGAAALLTAYPALVGVIQLVGGLWLVWMGRGMIVSARAQFRDGFNPDLDLDVLLGTVGHCYRQGVATNLSNPKVVLYFAAIIAPLMPPNPSFGVAALVIAAIASTTLLGFGAIVLALSTSPVRRLFMKAGPFVDLGSGAFFVIAGSTLAVNGAASFF
ncbi:LysE family translocator [Corynebacterium felinum]|nr:LysE family translocator [Corynebacterium felinum]MDF5820517.1 LysE family translocator [Corynebacterium felinum]